MVTTIDLGGISVEVLRKNIKNIHLSVYPPSGRVRISAPLRMDLDTIRVFAVSKLGWIRRHQRKLLGQERETPREYLDRESHYLWGRRYLLTVIEHDGPSGVELSHNRMRLRLRPGSGDDRKEAVVEEWYRDHIRAVIPSLLARWEPLMGVRVERVHIRKMRTRWGSCNPTAHSIRLNTDLAKKPPICLEYIVVHEMVHLLEPTHNERFMTLMDRFMPNWRVYRDVLNSLPVRHVEWRY